MRRRDFLGALSAAMVLPLRAHGQKRAVPVVGLLSSPPNDPRFVGAFKRGLGERGYVEGQNVVIEYRSAEGHYDRLPELATDLVRDHVDVLVTTGGAVTALAAKGATSTIPIVFACGDDPVEIGLVASLNRPGGNATGVSFFTLRLEVKRLELLRELMPDVAAIGMLVNPKNPNSVRNVRDVRAALPRGKPSLYVAEATTEASLDAAFMSLVAQKTGALIVATDPFLFGRRDQIVALATRHALPTIYEWREYVTAGGLMSYGASLTDAEHQLGIYAGRILGGENPAELPIVQPMRFELVINLKTARTLGIDVPGSILAHADEVIE